jgi:hypothetical protein
MNKKIGVFGIVFSSLLIFSIFPVSAEIFFSQQPREIYTLGEELSLTLGTDGEEGWADVNLVCDSASKMIFFNFITEKEKQIKLSVPLTKKFLRDLKGNCKITVSFNEAKKETMGFVISDKIVVDLKTDKKIYNPGEVILITGEVKKPNSDVSGSVKVSLSNSNIEYVLRIESNKFSESVEIPQNMPSGDYEVIAFAYEKDLSDEITNSGEAKTIISITQRAEKINLELPREAKPGESFNFKIVLTDQAGFTIDNKPVSISLFNSNKEKVLTSLSQSGNTNTYQLRKNAPKGYWNMVVVSEGLNISNQVLVLEHKEVEFAVENGTLFVKNIGNVPYTDFIEIKFYKNSGEAEILEEEETENDETENESLHVEIISVDLGVGKAMEFSLSAPDGEYSLNIKDNSKEIKTNAFLTGKAISVRNPNSKLNFFNRSFIVWFFIIGVLGLLVFLSSRSVVRQKISYAYSDLKNRKNESYGNRKTGGVIKITPGTVETGRESKSKSEVEGYEAEHKLVMDGSKQESAIVAVKIKNEEELRKLRLKEIDSLISGIGETMHKSGGRIYKKDDYIIGVFAPSITKTFDNCIKAVKSAREVSNSIKNHNQRYNSKVNFGIGVHSGEIIAKREKDKFLFTPLGLSMFSSKKLAEMADKDVLLTEEAYKKVLSRIKAKENPSNLGTKTYSITEIREEKDPKFINSFLSRNKDDVNKTNNLAK